MPSDNFLIFKGPGHGAVEIKGETKDEEFSKKNGLEITQFSFGVTNPTTIGSMSGGAGSGKAAFDPFAVTKKVDKASPFLFLASGIGGHYDTVELHIRKAGGEAMVYLQYTFKMVYVTKVGWSGGSGDDAPEESVEFAYGAMEIKYYPQKKDGSQDTPVQIAWSQVLNKPKLEVS